MAYISGWMEANGYPAVNSEKTIFMTRVDNDFILHGLFVDDMMHIPLMNHSGRNSWINTPGILT
jgi:hypothetical protein